MVDENIVKEAEEMEETAEAIQEDKDHDFKGGESKE